MTTHTNKSLRVLLVASSPLTRAITESDLLACSYDVVLAPSIDRAVATLQYDISAVICEGIFPDGDIMRLAAEIQDVSPETPVIAISEDSEKYAAVPGIFRVLPNPTLKHRLMTAVEEGRLICGVSHQQPVRTSLTIWSVSNLVALAAVRGWSIQVRFDTAPTPTELYLHRGLLWDARRAAESGETVLREILGLRSHSLEVISHVPSESSRTIHRDLDKFLQPALGEAIIWHRQLADLPGLHTPYRIDLGAAEAAGQDSPVVRRLARACSQETTLHDALRRARVESFAEAQAIRDLFGRGILRPITGVDLTADDRDNQRPYLEDPETLPNVESSRGVVFRPLQAIARVEQDEWADLDTGETAAKTSRRRWYTAIALVLFSIAGISFWAIGQDHSTTIEVEVLDDSDQ